MNQYINLTGAVLSLKVWRKSPQLFMPHFEAKNLSAINFAALKQRGIKGVILDKDNTITAPYQYHVHPDCQAGLRACQHEFGARAAIFSNTAGSSYDKSGLKARLIKQQLGIDVIPHTEQKPGGIAEVLQYFKCEPHELVVIGDRYFTDMLFGNLYGMLTIHTAPLTAKGENFSVKAVRRLEARTLTRLRRLGLTPPKHTLTASNDVLQ
jgi:phosphatidylglycerophosphatase GEP4